MKHEGKGQNTLYNEKQGDEDEFRHFDKHELEYNTSVAYTGDKILHILNIKGVPKVHCTR